MHSLVMMADLKAEIMHLCGVRELSAQGHEYCLPEPNSLPQVGLHQNLA